MMYEQAASATADYAGYVIESFQLTHDEAVSGVRYAERAERFPFPFNVPPVHLVVVDGEIFVVDEGAPPNLKPLSEDAGILRL